MHEAPTCTWKPSKKGEKIDAAKAGIAPTLLELKNEKVKGIKRLSNDLHSSCGHALKESLTLNDMMSLPEDSNFQDDHQYATLYKDLDAMMHLSVDEGEPEAPIFPFSF
mmetsp:Transcript_20890/g.45286  ORF Transcript_20890/g.45286 Transcript_20890/m.45286 type:complete len:109 (-) Transcript_20890:456-782(-)